ncbi:MAG: aromatic ring-hydroxylating dioxygenase subunit alpha [Thermoanaerobaculia bacterium]
MKPRTSHGQKTLPREYFVSPEIFAQEGERIFRGRWLYAGHVSEIPEPGRFVLFDLLGESVVVTADAEGRPRAFHNVCRHRGSRLCLEESGSLGTRIVCPYHAWSYGLDGRLVGAPNMSDVPGFDKGAHGLIEAGCEVREGLIFVHFGTEPPPLGEWLPPRAADWRISRLRSVHRTVYEVEANWKLFFHNYSECYHCPTVHPQLNRLTPYRATDNDLDEGPVLGGPMFLTRGDGGSMTMSGGRCAAPIDGLTGEDRERVYYYTLFPNLFLSLHPDYVLVHRSQALGPTRTRITCDWLFHPDSVEAPGFDPSDAVEFWDLTNRQDWDLCANAQRGIASSAYLPGPYAEIESQLAAFDREYLAAMGGTAGPRLAAEG